MRKFAFLFIFLSLCFLSFSSAGAFAEETETAPVYLDDALQQEELSDYFGAETDLMLPSVGSVAFRMFFFLLLVLGLIFILMVVVQKVFLRASQEGPSYQEAIKILSYRKFDVKKGIYLVDVLGKVLVIGSDIEGLNLISEITDPEQVAEAQKLSDAAPDIYKLNPFQGVLDRFAGDYQEESSSSRRRDRQTRGLIHKLDKMKSRLAK